MKSEHWKSIASITGITIVATTALLCGLDGLIFAVAVSALAGLGGFYLGKSRKP